MAGYRLEEPISFLKDWNIETKLGFSFRISTTESTDNILWRINYPKNDTLYLTHFGQDVVTLGKKSSLGSMAWSHTADLYIGFSKVVNWSFVKNLTFGVSLTHAIGKYKGIASVTSVTNDFNLQTISEDEYRSQDFSLGIRVGLCLWHK